MKKLVLSLATTFLLLSLHCTPLGKKKSDIPPGVVAPNPFGAATPCWKYLDESYQPAYPNNKKFWFDLYVPKPVSPVLSPPPRALVVFIHGGGFLSKDKRSTKDPAVANDQVARLLDNGYAFASINYRLLTNPGESEGIPKCVNDCLTFIQFIQANAATYRINPNKIALWGSSAGAGIAMLLAFDDSHAGLIEALYVEQPQASYDLHKWENPVFTGYCTTSEICSLIGIQKIKRYLGKPGLTDCSDLGSVLPTDWDKIDMLEKMSPDDPPIWIECLNLATLANCPPPPAPTYVEAMNHHPNHALALMNQALSLVAPFYFYYNITGPGQGKWPLGAPDRTDAMEFLMEELQ